MPKTNFCISLFTLVYIYRHKRNKNLNNLHFSNSSNLLSRADSHYNDCKDIARVKGTLIVFNTVLMSVFSSNFPALANLLICKAQSNQLVGSFTTKKTIRFFFVAFKLRKC